MKRCTLLLVLSLTLGACTTTTTVESMGTGCDLSATPPAAVRPTASNEGAQLCFQRQENNGSINILPSCIQISDYKVPLLGGQSICLSVENGSTEAFVSSTVPYNPASKDNQACKSARLKLDLRAGDKRLFTVEPKSEHSAYVCGWNLREKSQNRGTP
jgi:hypothetical protein